MVVALVVVSVLSGICEASILGVIAEAAAALVGRAHELKIVAGPFHIRATIGGLLGVGFALVAARLVLQVPIVVLPANLAAEVQRRLRQGLVTAFARASWSVQSRDREGELQELLTNQTGQASFVMLSLTGLVTSVLTLAVLVGSAFVLDALAAAITLVATVLLLSGLRPLNNLVGRRSHLLINEQISLARDIGQTARMAEEMDVFGVGSQQANQVQRLVDSVSRHFARQQVLAGLAPSVFQTAMYLLLIGGLFALHVANAGHVAALGTVVLLLVRSGAYGQQVSSAYQNLRQALPFVQRVREAEHKYQDSVPRTGDRRLPAITSIALEHASFEYTPGRPVLDDVSFEIAGGESVGIVGPSGAGKSTLTQILLRLRTPDSGEYLVNGVPGGEYAFTDWTSQVAYVSQEPRLLHTSVVENIRYFRDIDEAAVVEAAKLARIHDDITTWSDGYDSVIGPRADAISGGQQQRICIARALVGRPQMLILDEPTSALDPRSESLLQESLAALRGHTTLLIVAHRMSTLEMCDRILVLLDGRVNGYGPAAALLRDNQYYRSAISLSGAGSSGN
ncbi:MAG TPA: ABC transporter ATP-binding protein [Solirubrobacteraceae bacterium]|jgi:ABC-type multidrug transport system fused ATPase/permease subunit|nr:ABC transporter ATP-binding protein [Solirubrobacteraceae bacterium]